jgi:hypothetical protein
MTKMLPRPGRRRQGEELSGRCQGCHRIGGGDKNSRGGGQDVAKRGEKSTEEDFASLFSESCPGCRRRLGARRVAVPQNPLRRRISLCHSVEIAQDAAAAAWKEGNKMPQPRRLEGEEQDATAAVEELAPVLGEVAEKS